MVKLKNGQHSLREYLTLLIKPLASVPFAWACWYPAWSLGWHLNEPDATLFREPLVGFLGMFHAILAGIVASQVWGERREALRFIRMHDEKGFALALRDRIPRDIHLFIGSMSVLIWFAFAVLPYERAHTGFFSVGATSFLLAIYWQLSTTLDNPLKDPAVVAEIPKEWMRLGPDGKTYPRCLLMEDDEPHTTVVISVPPGSL